MKKTIAILGLLAVTLLLVGCGAQEAPAVEETAPAANDAPTTAVEDLTPEQQEAEVADELDTVFEDDSDAGVEIGSII